MMLNLVLSCTERAPKEGLQLYLKRVQIFDLIKREATRGWLGPAREETLRAKGHKV